MEVGYCSRDAWDIGGLVGEGFGYIEFERIMNEWDGWKSGWIYPGLRDKCRICIDMYLYRVEKISAYMYVQYSAREATSFLVDRQLMY